MRLESEELRKLLTQPPYNQEALNGDVSYEEYQDMIVDTVQLPDWCVPLNSRKDLPTYHVRITVLSPNNPSTSELRVTIETVDGTPVGEAFGNIVDAYDHVKDHLDGEVVFVGDTLPTLGKEEGSRETMYSVKDPKGEYFRGLFTKQWEHEEEFFLKTEYVNWLSTYLTYVDNPNDFYNSYQFINHHPALWSVVPKSQEWLTENFTSLWMGVGKTADNTTVIMLEGGSSVPPTRTHHYHDLRLDVTTPTYEEAVVKFAEKLNKFFHYDGVEKEGVEYEKSRLEKQLEKAFKLEDEDG